MFGICRDVTCIITFLVVVIEGIWKRCVRCGRSPLCPCKTVLLADPLTKLNCCSFSHHAKRFPEIVALKQLFPKIGSSPGFPPLLLPSVWRQKYVNKWEAGLVCSTLRSFSIVFLLVFMFFSWGAEARAIKGVASLANSEMAKNVCTRSVFRHHAISACCYLAQMFKLVS